ncbi:MAG: type II secretion system protein [Oscillospiraceae bacterium]|nr:type II secretion system protein [Oscillospiraceae bacterium]
MNLKRLGSKVKGFTLIELIVVIAIIGVLAGIMSTLISGFMRNARMEDNNKRAQLVFTGMQNQLIQCEINQDDSLFNPTNYGFSTLTGKDLKYVEVYFTINNGQLGDTICVKTIHNGGTYAGYASTTLRTEWYDKLKEAIFSFVDDTFEGFCAVYIDYEDYLVDSVICVEPEFTYGVDMKDYDTGVGQFMYQFKPYAPVTMNTGETDTSKKYRMLSSISAQEKGYDSLGVFFGAYPMVTSVS